MRKSLTLTCAAVLMAAAPTFAFAQQTDGGPSKGANGAYVAPENIAPNPDRMQQGRSAHEDYLNKAPAAPDELKTNPSEPVTQEGK